MVIKAAAVVMPMMIVGDAEHALDRADSTADACADCASDHPTDRAGDPVAF